MSNLFNYQLVDNHYEVVSLNDLKESITELVVPSKYNGKPVTTIQKGALSNLPRNVESIIFEDGIETLWLRDLPRDLIKLELPNGYNISNDDITTLQRLRELIIPADISPKTCAFTRIWSQSLQKLIIKSGSTIESLKVSHNSATEIILNDSIVELKNYAFSDCHNLRYIKLSEGLKIIGENAFRECISLRSITIPKSVEYIDKNAFKKCDNLNEILCESDKYINQWHKKWNSISTFRSVYPLIK